MKYYLIAGEASGDLHGSNLIAGLKKADPKAVFRFWGGDKMAREGGIDSLAKHYKSTAFFGITQIVLNLRTILGQLKECKEDILRFKPDVVILIDYPGFNFKIAKFAHENGLKTFYYIAPKVWAWKEWRVKLIRKYITKLFIIFPFEVEYFKKHGIDAIYEGNPIMDAIESAKLSIPSKKEFCEANGLDANAPIIALLAGSRGSEIAYNLPFMVKLSERFSDYQFIVGGVSWLDKSLYSKILKGTSIKLVEDQTYSLLHSAEAAVVTSGTATLETAIIGTPEFICYRIDPISYAVARIFVKIKFISLVNIIMNREVVKELIQEDMTIDNAERELRAILPNGSKLEGMKQDFSELRGLLRDSDTSARFAQRMYDILSKYN